MNKEKIIEYYTAHKGEVIGAGIGLIFAVFILFFGFIKFIFLSLCVVAGIYVGKKVYEDKDYVKKIFDRILRFFNM